MNGIRIELDYAAIEKLEKAVLRAAEGTMDELRSDVAKEQVMPFDSGNLQNGGTYASTSGEPRNTVSGNQAAVLEHSSEKVVAALVNDAPQARNLYHNPQYNFQKGNHPNAGGYWLAPWMSGGRKETFLRDEFAKLYKEEAKL